MVFSWVRSAVFTNRPFTVRPVFFHELGRGVAQANGREAQRHLVNANEEYVQQRVREIRYA